MDNQKISHIVLIHGRKSFVATTAICLNAVAEAIWVRCYGEYFADACADSDGGP